MIKPHPLKLWEKELKTVNVFLNILILLSMKGLMIKLELNVKKKMGMSLET
jgi:hypothetical protein